MNNHNRIKFALVGCGRISRKHLDILTGPLSARAEVVAVCDVRHERSAERGRAYNVPYYADYDDMLRSHPETDVVTVLTESGNHARHAIDIADRYRKHLVVEKPMALKVEDADRMIEVCRRRKVKMFVVKQNRYNLPVIKMRQALEAGRFGKLVMGTVRVRWKREQKYYDMDAWRGTRELDGGVFANQASHHIDLLEWMLGEPVSVYAAGMTALVNIEAEDTGVAVIKFKNGAIGVVEATTAARPDDMEGSLSLLGEKGAVEIGGFAVNKMRYWKFADSDPREEQKMRDFDENPPDVYGFGHLRYLENVLDALQNGSHALVDGEEGRKSLRLITAIYRSIQTGKEVKI